MKNRGESLVVGVNGGNYFLLFCLDFFTVGSEENGAAVGHGGDSQFQFHDDVRGFIQNTFQLCDSARKGIIGLGAHGGRHDVLSDVRFS